MVEVINHPTRVSGRILPGINPGRENRVYREPVGVVMVITPWNFPLQLLHRSLAPAIALGNSVVLKPAEDSQVTGGLLLSKIYEEAGRPAPRSSAPSTTRGRSAWRPTASPPRTASSTRSSTGYGNVRNSYAPVPPRRQTHRSARTSTTNSSKGYGTRSPDRSPTGLNSWSRGSRQDPPDGSCHPTSRWVTTTSQVPTRRPSGPWPR